MTRPSSSDHDRQTEANRTTRSLAALAMVLFLVVVGLLLVERLTSKSHLEDCLLAGRSNCAALLRE